MSLGENLLARLSYRFCTTQPGARNSVLCSSSEATVEPFRLTEGERWDSTKVEHASANISTSAMVSNTLLGIQ